MASDRSSEKRHRVPSGDTPKKDKQLRAEAKHERPEHPRRLSFSFEEPSDCSERRTRQPPWSHEEDSALVQFVALHKDLQNTDNEWPSLRVNNPYWEEARTFLSKSCGTTTRTVTSIRSRIVNVLKKKGTLDEVEKLYSIDYEDVDENVHSQKEAYTSSTCVNDVDLIKIKILELCELLVEKDGAQSLTKLLSRICALLGHDEILKGADSLFASVAKSHGIKSNASKYVSLSLEAMKNLQNAGKENLLIKFAQCVGVMRPDGTDTLMPIGRMPFGLVEYQVKFFTCTNTQQISMPQDYDLWHSVMVSEFGQRFNRLFRGPMWSNVSRDNMKIPIHAHVNVACVGKVTRCEDMKCSEYSVKPEVQVPSLKVLSECHKSGRFWVKADGTDLKAALQESTNGEWNGDVDLGDGKLRKLRQKYEARIHEVHQCADNTHSSTESQLFAKKVVDGFTDDKEFLVQGLKSAVKVYETKFDKGNTPEETLKGLNWEVVEYSKLLEQAQHLILYINDLLDLLRPEFLEFEKFIRDFEKNRGVLLDYLKNLFKKKRQPAATHVLVVMVSEERRNRKPYAVPVQYIPYHSFGDQFVRQLLQEVKKVMVENNMEVVGTVTDGEFSTLRTNGETRPLHIWQLIHDVKQMANKISKQKLEMILQCTLDANGKPVAIAQDQRIPQTILEEIHDLQKKGIPFHEAVAHVRSNLVPHGHTPMPYRHNQPETQLDIMRSLVATLYFRHAVSIWKSKGVDFSIYLYVPEESPTTGTVHHEREDHCHILKRVAKHTREGAYMALNLDAFDEAMRDPSTGLTHTALVGKRKQSVTDAEKLLSYHVANFLSRKGYNIEAKYVEIVAKWHEASDGRGMSQLQRCKANYAMLNYLLEALIPWYNCGMDLSTMDINRSFSGLRGFSRETAIAITTNIESQEFRRRENYNIGWEEHPRGGTTDDVECFFSLYHQQLGTTFTLKEFKNQWRKICREFSLKLDDELPFYYWSLNERFRGSTDTYESFDQSPEVEPNVAPEKHPLRLHRLTLNRREDASIFTAGRSFLPVRNKQSIRQRLHRNPVGLPAVI